MSYVSLLSHHSTTCDPQSFTNATYLSHVTKHVTYEFRVTNGSFRGEGKVLQ